MNDWSTKSWETFQWDWYTSTGWIRIQAPNTGVIVVKRRPSHAQAAKDNHARIAKQKDAEKPRVRRIGSIVGQLISRRGYAQVSANEAIHQLILAEVGADLGAGLQVGNLRQGVLHVYASDSATLQELNFRKRGILKRLQRELAESKIKDLRFRIQT